MALILITGESHLAGSAAAFKMLNHTVKYNIGVDEDPRLVFSNTEPALVIAHGDDRGVVYWRTTVDGSKQWLSSSGKSPSDGSVIYMYCCHVGPKLRAAWDGARIFGHCASVPMPDGSNGDHIFEYLKFATQIVWNRDNDSYVFEHVRAKLHKYAKRIFANEMNERTMMDGGSKLYLLMRSLER